LDRELHLGIADDVLRDLFKRGKYADVILPMTVLRRLDAVLEPTKKAVLDMRAKLDVAKVVNQDAPLRQAAGQAFYNTSRFTLRDLRNRSNQQQLNHLPASRAVEITTWLSLNDRYRSTRSSGLATMGPWRMALCATSRPEQLQQTSNVTQAKRLLRWFCTKTDAICERPG
jgi:hypothetical protein